MFNEKYKIILLICQECYFKLDNTTDSMLTHSIRNQLAEYIEKHMLYVSEYVKQSLEENNTRVSKFSY